MYETRHSRYTAISTHECVDEHSAETLEEHALVESIDGADRRGTESCFTAILGKMYMVMRNRWHHIRCCMRRLKPLALNDDLYALYNALEPVIYPRSSLIARVQLDNAPHSGQPPPK